MMDNDAQNLFKKFSFEKKEDWRLPSVDVLYKDDLWSLDSLNDLKNDLNSTKSLLNDKGEHWQQHTSTINKAGFVIDFIKKRIHPELLTQAWCKFYEILCSFDVIGSSKKNLRSLHLCEAPGAFISALNYYLCLNYPSMCWEWMANTLNPYYEGHSAKAIVTDDRLLFPTIQNWYFGEDNTGDILSSSYLNDLLNVVKMGDFVDLVTADGSIFCLDNPAEQELLVSELHFSELLIALSCLASSGNFVLKKFTFFECATVCEIYLLNCVFEKVCVFKPFTSKAGNSEVYVICLQYLGVSHVSNYIEKLRQAFDMKNSKAMFPLSQIPNSFILQLIKCCKTFTTFQKNAIRENLSLYSCDGKTNYSAEELKNIKTVYAELFLEKYPIITIDQYKFQKLYSAKKQILTSFHDERNRSSKLLCFQALGQTYENILKSKAMSWLDILLDVEKRADTCYPMNKKRSLEALEWTPVWKEIPKRMKVKNYADWIILGKCVKCIKNSKFCNPLILYLWNRVSHESQIEVKDHELKSCNYWDNDILDSLVENEDLGNCVVVSMFDMASTDYESDPFLKCLKHTCKLTQVFSLNTESEDIEFSGEARIKYVNTTCWLHSLHQETIIKQQLPRILYTTIKAMNKGDILILCLQSSLTRYTSGLLYSLLSLFAEFTSLLPNTSAPAAAGQIWVLKNFQKPKWTDSLLQYLRGIHEVILPEGKEVLEIVPITAMCGMIAMSFFPFRI